MYIYITYKKLDLCVSISVGNVDPRNKPSASEIFAVLLVT